MPVSFAGFSPGRRETNRRRKPVSFFFAFFTAELREAIHAKIRRFGPDRDISV